MIETPRIVRILSDLDALSEALLTLRDALRLSITRDQHSRTDYFRLLAACSGGMARYNRHGAPRTWRATS